MRSSSAKFVDEIEDSRTTQIEALDERHKRFAPRCAAHNAAQHAEDLCAFEVGGSGVQLRRIGHARLQHRSAHGDLLGELQTAQVDHKLNST